MSELTIEDIKKCGRYLLNTNFTCNEYVQPNLKQMKKWQQQIIDIHNVQKYLNKVWKYRQQGRWDI